MAEAKAGQTGRPALWNPNAAANWCLLFTPAFGAYLHMLNWRALGEPERAATSQKWFYASIALLILHSLVLIAHPNPEAGSQITRGIAVAYLFAWYFASAKSQAKIVKERLGTDYVKRPWGKALGIALLGFLGFVAATTLLGVIVELLR